MENTLPSAERQAPLLTSEKRGSWNVFPFFIGTAVGLQLAGGSLTNLMVYLINEFNINSIDAAQLSNVVCGSATLVPVVAAVGADSFLGCFSVIWISSIIYMLGLISLLLTAALDNLHPTQCEGGSNPCVDPSSFQYAILYISLAMIVIGQGGTAYNVPAMGANQFTNPIHRSQYFTWHNSVNYGSTLVHATVLIYVQENVSWEWGFGICLAGIVVALAIFLIGSPYYYHVKPQGSPLTSLARVIVVSVRRRKEFISSRIEDYYYGHHDGDSAMVVVAPTTSLRSLNRAALKTKGDIQENGSIAKPWDICTVQQVEDLKTLIQLLPLWSSAILLTTPLTMQMTLAVVQGLTMDRHVGQSFQIPAASMLLFVAISIAVGVVLFDHIVWPIFKKVAKISWDLTLLQRLGIGHAFTIASMAVSGMVESERRAVAWSGSMSIFWLVPQLALVGIAASFHYPVQLALYYQEFPSCLKSISTAMFSLVLGIAFYLSSGVIGVVRSVTNWLPPDINHGRLENLYWVMVVLVAVNFGYYILCSWMYKYKNNVQVV